MMHINLVAYGTKLIHQDSYLTLFFPLGICIHGVRDAQSQRGVPAPAGVFPDSLPEPRFWVVQLFWKDSMCFCVLPATTAQWLSPVHYLKEQLLHYLRRLRG